MRIYEVGGTVRDRILGLPVNHDRDYAVECNSYSEMRDYIASVGKIWQERPEFLTIRAKMPDLGDADFVMCRKDGFYSDGRRPDSVQPGTIYDDLARRDFTMNAIAVDTVTGKIIDPFFGIHDIKFGLIRCVGSTRERFTEDSLRMVRALRFCVTKEMALHRDIDLFLRQNENIELIRNVAPDRIREELNKMFIYNTAMSMYCMNEYSSLFYYIFSEMGISLRASQETK